MMINAAKGQLGSQVGKNRTSFKKGVRLGGGGHGGLRKVAKERVWGREVGSKVGNESLKKKTMIRRRHREARGPT